MSTSVRSGSNKPTGSKSARNRRRASAGTGSAADRRRSPSGSEPARIEGRLAAEAAAATEAGARGIRVSSRSLDRSSATARAGRRSADRAGPLRRMIGHRLGVGRRVGGVAPFVPPRNRVSRRMRMREWSRRGFVQLSPAKQKLRHRILPRTVIGIAGLLMAAGIGAAFSGAAFYAYYDNRLAENERTVARFVEGFDQQFTDAAGALDDMRTEAVETIRTELDPLDGYVADARAVVGLPATAGPSVWLLETRNEAGEVSHGAAFAIVGHQGGTALITSYSAVLASTTEPSPAIELLKGGTRIPATLWAWDEQRDLALLVVDLEIPVLELAGEGAQVQAVGGPIYAMSGYGAQGATASPGVLLDQSQAGLQHTAPLGPLFQGGPLLDAQGRVVGVASRAYSPLGIDQGAVSAAPDVPAICARILRCSELADEVTTEVAVAD